MRPLRIGLAQINATVGDLDGNLARIVDAIGRARAQGVDLLAFPEMCVTGYPPEDLLLRPAFIQSAMTRTRALAEHTTGMTVVVGTVDRDADLYNAAAVFHDGRFVTCARKRHLPNYGVFDENRYFTSERESLLFARDGAVFGVNICEDIWVSSGPCEEQARDGAEVIVNLSASPYHAGKLDERRRLIATRATENRAVVCYVNLVGAQDEIAFDGGSMVVDPNGETLAEGARFDEDLVVVDVDLDEVFHARLHDPRLRTRHDADDRAPLARVHLASIPAAPKPALAARAPIVDLDEHAEVYTALTVGVRDYVRKNGFDTVLLGLSGGIDSALTACIAADALGPAHVVGVAMPSPYSSPASSEDAAALAAALGIRFETIPIRDTMQAYTQALATLFAGRASDLTEENLQARIRGTLLMALSNKFNQLVLTTGNKSETSVGYSTLYGDTAGGFAVLKDVYKTQVYALCAWRNARGAVIPERTLTRPPSAELRPDQTDQDSLPPYDVLDAILRAYVEEDALDRRDRARRPRRGTRDAYRADGGPVRVQAPPESARARDHAARVRQGSPPADHEPLARLKPAPYTTTRPRSAQDRGLVRFSECGSEDRAEQRVRRAERHAGIAAHEAGLARVLQLATQIDADLGERRDAEPDAGLIRGDVARGAAELVLGAADAREGIEAQRSAHGQHRVQAIGGDVGAGTVHVDRTDRHGLVTERGGGIERLDGDHRHDMDRHAHTERGTARLVGLHDRHAEAAEHAEADTGGLRRARDEDQGDGDEQGRTLHGRSPSVGWLMERGWGIWERRWPTRARGSSARVGHGSVADGRRDPEREAEQPTRAGVERHRMLLGARVEAQLGHERHAQPEPAQIRHRGPLVAHAREVREPDAEIRVDAHSATEHERDARAGRRECGTGERERTRRERERLIRELRPREEGLDHELRQEPDRRHEVPGGTVVAIGRLARGGRAREDADRDVAGERTVDGQDADEQHRQDDALHDTAP
jgi:NAD+ synthase (glutamine-hydrolysing)